MAGAGHHFEFTAANLDPLLGDETQKRLRGRRDHSQILQPIAEQELRAFLRQPMRAVEAAIRLRSQSLRVETNVERDQIFRFAHRKLQSEALAEPTGEAHMVGVKVGGDDPCQSAAAKRPGKQRLPRRARLRVVDSRIDDSEPVAIFDQIDVDVIEPERKRETGPQDARTDLDRFAGLGGSGLGNTSGSGIARFDIVWLFVLCLPPRAGSIERQEARRACRVQFAARVRAYRRRAPHCADGPRPRRG